jgi:hypothetical protein
MHPRVRYLSKGPLTPCGKKYRYLDLAGTPERLGHYSTRARTVGRWPTYELYAIDRLDLSVLDLHSNHRLNARLVWASANGQLFLIQGLR